MISERDVEAYRRDGYIVVPDVLDAAELGQLQAVIDDWIARAAGIDTHDDIYDLEPSHTRAQPRVRRIKTPHKIDRRFSALVRHPNVLAILTKLIGPDLRLHGSKLNMKAPRYGSPVEWHQDWAFYPHTNDDILAIGVMLDDMELSNGPLLVVPGSHRGAIHDHHADGVFCGAISPDLIRDEASRAVPLTGRAGSMSFHHVRLLHGSALNTSNRRRQLLLYEVAAADAWPLVGVSDLAEFNSRMIAGQPTITPRVTPVPVRMPLPPAANQGSIYENQTGSRQRFFATADAVN
ncbi:MAG TPA: phytanoyl-CoA dioxygenase family protein [Vineibacter sp.]|nr:phytanoyl-CoA dioxygenase family protein [Vineibacter sp.]